MHKVKGKTVWKNRLPFSDSGSKYQGQDLDCGSSDNGDEPSDYWYPEGVKGDEYPGTWALASPTVFYFYAF